MCSYFLFTVNCKFKILNNNFKYLLYLFDHLLLYSVDQLYRSQAFFKQLNSQNLPSFRRANIDQKIHIIVIVSIYHNVVLLHSVDTNFNFKAKLLEIIEINKAYIQQINYSSSIIIIPVVLCFARIFSYIWFKIYC